MAMGPQAEHDNDLGQGDAVGARSSPGPGLACVQSSTRDKRSWLPASQPRRGRRPPQSGGASPLHSRLPARSGEPRELQEPEVCVFNRTAMCPGDMRTPQKAPLQGAAKGGSVLWSGARQVLSKHHHRRGGSWDEGAQGMGRETERHRPVPALVNTVSGPQSLRDPRPPSRRADRGSGSPSLSAGKSSPEPMSLLPQT